MSKTKILVVEDDFDISNMLNIYFSGKGYDVEIAGRGMDALEKTRLLMPRLIVLDIMLPDIDGYEVCRRLRTNTRTSHIPVIFLTQKDERSDKLQGLELGADDYITKPFDMEELKLRVQNAITRSERESLTDSHSGLPSGRLIEEQLRRLILTSGWTLLDLRVSGFDTFREAYGFVAGDDVIRFTARLLSEVVDTYGNADDFIGHVGGDNLMVVSTEDKAREIEKHMKEKFNQQVLAHYNFMDRDQGYILINDDTNQPHKMPLMSLSAGMVSSSEYAFSDIREISELAAEARRKDTAGAA